LSYEKRSIPAKHWLLLGSLFRTTRLTVAPDWGDKEE